MKSFLSALRFLTICPGLTRLEHDDRALARSIFWFPTIGAMCGMCLAAIAYTITPWIGQPLSAIIVVISMIAVSGGLHADGLADMGDGFLSSRPKEKIMEIMRDSRIGTMGMLMLLAMILLKIGVLISLPTDHYWKAVLLMPIAGRCAIVWQLSSLTYARKSGGLCDLFVRYHSSIDTWVASLTLLAISCLCFELQGLIIFIACRIIQTLLNQWCEKKIGGFTGDTLGASCEIIEWIPAILVLLISKVAHP